MVVELRSLEENLGSMLFSRSSKVLEGKQNFAAPPLSPLEREEDSIRLGWSFGSGNSVFLSALIDPFTLIEWLKTEFPESRVRPPLVSIVLRSVTEREMVFFRLDPTIFCLLVLTIGLFEDLVELLRGRSVLGGRLGLPRAEMIRVIFDSFNVFSTLTRFLSWIRREMRRSCRFCWILLASFSWGKGATVISIPEVVVEAGWRVPWRLPRPPLACLGP